MDSNQIEAPRVVSINKCDKICIFIANAWQKKIMLARVLDWTYKFNVTGQPVKLIIIIIMAIKFHSAI